MSNKCISIRNVSVKPLFANTQIINPNIVEVEFKYDNGAYRPRGYYISVSPVFKNDSSVQYSIGPKNFRHHYELIEKAKRFSQKRLEKLFNNLDQKRVNDILNYLVSENELAIVE